MNKIKRQERLAKLKQEQKKEIKRMFFKCINDNCEESGICLICEFCMDHCICHSHICNVLCSKCDMCEHHCECEEFED